MDRPEQGATGTAADTPVQAVDPRLLDILVCPVTRTPVVLKAGGTELWCRASGLAYPVRDGIPVMLENEARELSAAERETL